ncbi:thioredoxin [Mycobacterium spongiae]|uniref:Thioredoxin n=2 Tax=Mycobacterium spongiae TaxID=886343 RepID=A0A975PZ66_9MYCO|nr:thioredoxin [Mycobacterium spongiae]
MIVVAAAALAVVVAWLLTRRSGIVREVDSGPAPVARPVATDLGLSRTGPTVVHFSAPWCVPCDQVRRVVEHVCGNLGDVAHVEVDMDAHPQTAHQFSVLSLPTTVIVDANGRQRYRTSSVPKAADLRAALEPLLA